MMAQKNRIWTIVPGAFLLSLIALYNGFPLVFSDTGTYLYSGFGQFIPNDRPITYGLFIRLASLEYSTWFVILVQNLLTAYVIFEVLHLFRFTKTHFNRSYFTILLTLVLFTGIGWYSNQLMPDFFAPIVILVIFILLKKEKASVASKICLGIILALAVVSHFSHLLIATILVIILVAFKVLFRKSSAQIRFPRVIVVMLIVVASWFILPAVNYLTEQKFILSKGTHVFLMAHLTDTGILQQYLNTNCSKPSHRDYKICQYKDSLPQDLASFMWESDIVENSGGWDGSRDEYNAIIRSTLVQPNYLFLNIYRSLTYSFIQLTRIHIGDGLTSYRIGSAPYGQISWRFPNEVNNYLNSKQNKWDGVNLRFSLVNIAQLILIISSLFVLLNIGSRQIFPLLDEGTRFFLLFVIIAIFINALTTAGLNAPTARFQARVMWLFPFSMIVLCVQNLHVIVKTAFPYRGRE